MQLDKVLKRFLSFPRLRRKHRIFIIYFKHLATAALKLKKQVILSGKHDTLYEILQMGIAKVSTLSLVPLEKKKKKKKRRNKKSNTFIFLLTIKMLFYH
jgi:hypothetical protein